MAQTPLPTNEQMGGAQSPVKKREAELAAIMDKYDQQLGLKQKEPTPWHKEPKLSNDKKEALDALEPKERGSGGFYKETPEQKKQQEQFDQSLKDVKDPGTGTWQATPPTKKERLLAWHKSLGSPQHIIDAELAQLKEQEGQQ